MKKRITKIICAIVASTFVLGAVAATGCSNFYGASPLPGDISSETPAVSNGGFAVEKGNFIYYVNGIGVNTSVNEYGTPVKGAIYRISKDNLKAGNYSTVDRVVPQIAYSSGYNAGLFVYGDRIYYGTPSIEKNSEGEVQNKVLDMKSTKLDGTETMKEAYVQFPTADYEYRFVEEEGTVYLLYVATDEKLYEESTGVKNLHSYNTATGTDTLLAYNVSEVLFDSENKENYRVYYTMNVYDYGAQSNKAYGYNQLYTVKASATKDKFEGKLNSDSVFGWNDDKEKGEVDRYINCGDLVLDGIGYSDYLGNDLKKTVFNHDPSNASVNDNVTNDLSYTYTPRQYVDGTVYYTRTTSTDSSAQLFSFEDTAKLEPIDNNKEDRAAILTDGSNAGDFKFVKANGRKAVLYAESKGGISINYFDANGKLGDKLSDVPVSGGTNDYFPIVRNGTATILTVSGNYLYYSVSGGNGYTINRVDYTGDVEAYNRYQEANGDYKAVKILDLDASSSWYKPEILSDYLFFASSTTNMTSYNYIMVFDLKFGGDTVLGNDELRDLNERYESIEKKITDVYGDKDNYPTGTFKNLQNALRYAFYNGDYDYLKKFAKELNDAIDKKAEEDDKDDDKDKREYEYSEETFIEYDRFLDPTKDGDKNVWADYTKKKTVNGRTVYENSRDYYYALLGCMSEEDEKAYAETLQSAYLASKPEAEPETAWFEGLSAVEKAFFIIGMCLIGIAVIGGGVWLTIYFMRRKNKKPVERKKRIKVDTTDDKSIDVYSTEDAIQNLETVQSGAEEPSQNVAEESADDGKDGE